MRLTPRNRNHSPSHPRPSLAVAALLALLFAACSLDASQDEHAAPSPLTNEARGADALLQLPANSPPYIAQTWQSALTAPLPNAFTLGVFGPAVPASEQTLDLSGLLGSYQPGGPTTVATNAFFQPLGTNGRTCATCHQPPGGMSISKLNILTRYLLSGVEDPLFAPVDGANCPNSVPASSTSPSHLGGLKGLGKAITQAAAHSLILDRGVMRIFLPVPANAQFTISVVSDPNGCNTDPSYNQVTNPTTGVTTQIISVYRRPRISSNLQFVTTGIANTFPFVIPPQDPITGVPLPVNPYSGQFETGNIMWDGREPTLQSQAVDATLSHAQALAAPSTAQINEIVAFETGFFSAQSSDFIAGSLTAKGAVGGPVNLPAVAPGQLASLLSTIRFTDYNSWSTVTGSTPAELRQESIYRGQQIFNTGTFTVSNVAGLNNITAIGNNAIASCGLCHNQVEAGNDSFPNAQHNIGVAGDAPAFGGPQPATDLPIFKIVCNSGTSTVYNGTTVYTNDPGLALITGQCADVGRTSVPQLRALAAHPPYFHDGSAQTLLDVVNFYNTRFNIGYTAQEKTDLVNFLNAL